jgi:two-component system nitrate/nitrite response regulator NarP
MKPMTRSDRVRVVVVDDSAVARSAIEDAVVQASEFELVASTASGEEALAVVPRVDPDLVLMDVCMPGLDGHETSRLLRARGSRAHIVLVSALGRLELPVGVESCGANAILDKSEVSPRRLATLWRQLQSGDAVLAVADSA